VGTLRFTWLALALAALSLLPAAPASADDPAWAAKFAGQSPYLFLESGQLAESQFSAKNIGSQTWTKGVVRLGTVNWPYPAPPDRASAFYVPNDWLNNTRPAALDQASVPPQGIGTFTFRVLAPHVDTVREFQENFAPVAENIRWMGCNGCQWDNVFLVYRVFPPQDPSVTITQAPRSVTAGDPIDVSADASDNLAVNRVVFSLDDQQIVVNAAPYKVRFSSAGLGAGSHVVIARAYDNAGHQDSDVASFSVQVPAGEPTTPPTTGHPLPAVGVSINEGALFTNSPLVRLRLRPPEGATDVLISNDGGFTDATSSPITGEQTLSWMLVSTGPERLPKTVYVRFNGGGVDESKNFTDDIVLDETPPIVRRAVALRRGNRKVKARRAASIVKGCAGQPLSLRVRARDATSGVRGLAYGFSRRQIPINVKFKSKVPIRVPVRLSSAGAVFLRVRDGAGNVSKLRKVSLRHVCR
jgi:hypothetical protein